jgi:signal transduction histidine kinase
MSLSFPDSWIGLALVLGLLLSLLLPTSVGVIIGSRIRNRTGLLFTILMAAYAYVALIALITLSVDSIELKESVARFRYLGFSVLAPLWLLLSVEIFQRAQWLFRPWAQVVLWTVPAATWVITLIPNLQDLQVTNFSLISAWGLNSVRFEHGPFFKVYYGFAYLVIFGFFVLALLSFLRGSKTHRKQAPYLAGATLVIILLDYGVVQSGHSSRWFYAPVLFHALHSMAFLHGILRTNLFDLRGLATAQIVDHLATPLLVFDQRGDLFYQNDSSSLWMKQFFPNISEFQKNKMLFWESLPFDEKNDLQLGNNHWFHCRQEELFDKHLHYRGKTFQFIDISLKKQKWLQQESLNELRDRLMTLLAHDVSGNLKGLSFLCENIITGKVPPSSLPPYLGMIAEASLSAQLLVTNLLEWLKTQQPDLKNAHAPLDLLSCCRRAIKEGSALAYSRNISVILQTIESTAETLGDSEMITSILRNLLSNALQHSPEGSKIQIEIIEHRQSWRVSISDQGPGVTNSLKGSLRDSQIPYERRPGGYGLGLRFVKDFLRVHNSSLNFDSPPGYGTRVSFDLKRTNIAVAS